MVKQDIDMVVKHPSKISKYTKEPYTPSNIIAHCNKIEELQQKNPDFVINDSCSSLLEFLYIYNKEEIKLVSFGKLSQTKFTKTYLLFDEEKQQFCTLLFFIKEILFSFFSRDDFKQYIEDQKDKMPIWHDKLIIPREFFETETAYIFKAEYRPNDCLLKEWKNVIQWSEMKKINLLKQLIESIRAYHLHEWEIAQVASTNIFIDIDIEGSDICTLSQMSIGKYILSSNLEDRYIAEVTKCFDVAPPEIYDFRQDVFSREEMKKMDIWSLGVIAYRLFSNKHPYDFNVEPDKKIGDFPSDIHFEMKKMFVDCLSRSPEKRPSLEKIWNKTCEIYQKMLSKSDDSNNNSNEFWNALQLYSDRNNQSHICIKVTMNNRKAEIYCYKGIMRADYQAISGINVLNEISYPNTNVKNIDISQSTILSETKRDQTLSDFDFTVYQLQQVRTDDHIQKLQKNVQQLVCDYLEINNNVVICKSSRSNFFSKKFSYNNLLNSENVYVVYDGKDFYCESYDVLQNQIQTKGKRTGHLFAPSLAYLYRYRLGEVYLDLKKNDLSVVSLYLQTNVSDAFWNRMLLRIRRANEILWDCPSSLFVNVRQPLEIIRKKGHIFGIQKNQYLPGVTLKAILERGIKIPNQSKILIIYILARALRSLHSIRCVHRHITPSSIFLGVNGQVRLSSFTIAKYEPDSAPLHDHIQFSLKTEKVYSNYSSPEQINDELGTVGRQSDIWSWGTIAYELFTGQSPFKNFDWENSEEIKFNFFLLPENLRDLIKHSLITDPKERILTSDELHDQLVEIMIEY